jgi:hypothetical protein
MTTTTLRRIRACHPCTPSWRRLVRRLGGMHAYGLDTPIPMTRILDVLELGDAIWACRTLPVADLPRLVEFAARCAARVEHLRSAAAATRAARARAAVAAIEAYHVAAAIEAAEADRATVAASDATYYAAAAAEAEAEADAWYTERAAQAEIFREIFG